MPPPLAWTAATLTGRSREHIVELELPRCALHRDVAAPFLAMRTAAAAADIDLQPVSGFRDFERQLLICNGNSRGERALLDRAGMPLDALALDDDARVAAILYWSALPGASRHHWGTEVDVIDAAVLPAGETVHLQPGDYAPDGRYAHLNVWLDDNAASFGFFRPYATDRGGVQPEPWHLSYAPVAGPALEAFSLQLLREVLAGAGIDAGEAIERRLPDIWARYVVNVDPAPLLAQAAPGFNPASRPS